MDAFEPAVSNWAPQACTLPTAAQPLRVAEFDALFATALHQVLRPGPQTLRLHLALDAAPTVQELVDRETACCSFFTFHPVVENGQLRLDVQVPEAHHVVLDGLESHARAAAGRR